MTTPRKKTSSRAARAPKPVPSEPQAAEAPALAGETPAGASPESPETSASPAEGLTALEGAALASVASCEGASEVQPVPGVCETSASDGAASPDAEARGEALEAAEGAPAVLHREAAEDEEASPAVRLADVSVEVEEMFPDGPEGAEPGEDASLAVMEDSLRHGRRVAVIVATLFEDLMELHGLSDEWGHRLHHAALLHDIGFVEGRKGHHKASMRLIEENADLPEEERPWIALLARYHRKAWPSRRHARFAALKKRDRKALRKAAAILRIADALDYGHAGAVGPLAVTVRKRRVILAIQCRSDCSAEVRRVAEKSDLFRHVFGRKLECLSLHD